MALKLSKDDTIFRNELIFTLDAKALNIDYTLINLYMLLKYNGTRPRSGRARFFDFERINNIIQGLEENDFLEGFRDNPKAANYWLRSNLVNLVSRGKADKEKISSLRPIHLESYKIRNIAHSRDYNSSEQVYLMLSEQPNIREELKKYLAEGWDAKQSSIINPEKLDIDSLGILHLTKHIKETALRSANTVNKIKPIFKDQSNLFCDDIRRLLVYKESIPRNVLIDYLKTIISFHLSLYVQKLIYLLPKIVSQGNLNIEDDWNVTLDLTDNYDSKISELAVKDAELMNNRIYDYIRATFKINASLNYLGYDRSDSGKLQEALNEIVNNSENFERAFESDIRHIIRDLRGSKEEKEEVKELIKSLTQFDKTYFDKYVTILVKQKGAYQYKYHLQLIDNLSQKNNERGFMAQGRSKKHPRKYVLGTKLLETLVQILVLDATDTHFITRSLSIDELTQRIRDRYGLIINGVNEKKYQNTDLNTNIAFKENMDALKNKLRQIGFYNDLSDAYILQKVRPRYNVNNSKID